MKTSTASDNWWDKNHTDGDLLYNFSDQELQNELNKRQAERRKLDIMKIIGSRDPVGFFTIVGGDELHIGWELHIIFSNATKHRFDFSSRVGQTEKIMDDFRMLYFPHLTRLDLEDYQRMINAKQNKKKRVCRRR